MSAIARLYAQLAEDGVRLTVTADPEPAGVVVLGLLGMALLILLAVIA